MRSSAWYDPNYEKRITKIAKNYIGKYGFGYFLFDFLACVPVLLYEAAHGFTTDYEEKYEQIHSNQYITYVWFKIFKILMLARIFQLLNFVEILLNSFFESKIVTINNLVNYIKACLAFAVMIHIFACAWIYVGALEHQWMTEE